jgi:hypothetical protein
LSYVALGVAGFVIMLASVFLFVRTIRRRASVERPPTGGSAPQQPPKRPGTAGGLDSWWSRATERWRQRWEERGGQGPP